ncbi:MAG TPA: hypothetical protein VKK81_23700 [Candidatus Binatia bacterium]|nr:hypothetical protein [Candidatus Binatia bacterium]
MARLFVGNLPWSATEVDLRDLFAACGTVEQVVIVHHRDTGRSRGFSFVEMRSRREAPAVNLYKPIVAQ